MTFCRDAASLAAPQSVEENVPVMIFTPSRVTSRVASEAAAVGSTASPVTKTSFLPITPPKRSLMRSRMISNPSRWRLPSAARLPVSGSSTPILYSPLSCCPWTAPTPSATATKPSSTTTHFTCRMPTLLWLIANASAGTDAAPQPA